MIPLIRDGKVEGTIGFTRLTKGRFSQRQIELVETFADQAVIAIENARLFDEVQAKTRELEEALTYQTGSSNILGVIASSPTDVGPVLEAIVKSACELCEAYDATVALKDGDDLRFSAHHGPIPISQDKWPINRNWTAGRAFLDQRPVHVRDLQSDEDFPEGRELSLRMGHRSILSVPLLREGESIGTIVLRRTEVQPFSDKQIALLQTFADQAVIAIGNVRLFEEVQAKTRELSEALTYQTGSSNILSVIASSPTDVAPVLEAIVKSACELCEAYDATVALKDGDDLRFSAHHGPIPISLDKWPINRNWTAGRAFLDQKPVHVGDLQSDEDFPEGRELSLRMGHRSILSVPLLREGESVGAIVLRRTEVQPFSDKQIALLQTFAEQAVIAIGNVRLFEEVQAKTRDLTEALTYQTGSSNILRVIASSPTDVGPVLNAIVESASKLCEAYDAVVLLKDGDDLRFSAHHGPIPINIEKWPISRNWTAGRAFMDRRPVHVPDMLSDEGSEFPDSRELSRHAGFPGIRSILSVPLLRENESIGTILLRRTEVQPFSDKQIALLQTFADQAVIAIGNVRLFYEVQAKTRDLTESLEQQTATSEVLEVISASTGELQPVFKSMLDNATRICGANFGTMSLYEDGAFRPVAFYNVPQAYAEKYADTLIRPHPQGPLGTVARTHEVVHVEDTKSLPVYIEGHPAIVAISGLAGARTIVIVPMLRENELVGTIAIYRQEVRPFSEKQISLLTNFAKQAVIAIENTRLLKELRERTDNLSESLQQQTATSEVLEVISSSPGELEPVFQAMLENATRICEAKFGTLYLSEGDGFRAAAMHNAPPAYEEARAGVVHPPPYTGIWRTAKTKQVVQIADITLERGYIEGDPFVVSAVTLGGYRGVLTVPMLHEDKLIGVIAIFRQEVRPFSDRQIELLTNFAAQAVIAIENTRLLRELRERTDDLSKSLQ